MRIGHVRGRRSVVGLAIIGLVAGGMLLGAPATNASPERIAQIEADLEALGQEQAYANEMVLTAQYELDQINAKISRTENRVARAKASLADTQDTLGRYAASAYRSGGIDSSLQVLLSDDPQEFLDQAVVLDILSRGQSAALRKTQTARLNLAQATAELAQQRQYAEVILADMEATKAMLDETVAETEAYLAQLQEEERQRLEEERRRREAAQAAAAAAAAAAQQGGGSGGGSSSGGSSGGGSGGGYSGGSGASSDRAAIAVAYALAQVGEPYVNTPPGAQPPNSWDCSKLTAAAWAQAGVYLTPYSAAQINEVRTISQSELQPGDLLFYYNPSWGRVGHVSMYIGGGQVVEASSPSTGVRIYPVYWGNFVKAGRPYG